MKMYDTNESCKTTCEKWGNEVQERNVFKKEKPFSNVLLSVDKLRSLTLDWHMDQSCGGDSW